MLRAALATACVAVATVLAPPAPATGFAVESECNWFLANTPNSFDVLFVLVAEAAATGSTPAATTTVTCTAQNVFGESVTATATSLGPRVYAASSRIMTLAPPSYCSSSTAIWLYTEHTIDVRQHGESEAEHCHPTRDS